MNFELDDHKSADYDRQTCPYRCGRANRWHKGGKSRKKYRNTKKHRHYKKRASLEAKPSFIVLASVSSDKFSKNFDRVSREIGKLNTPQHKKKVKNAAA